MSDRPALNNYLEKALLVGLFLILLLAPTQFAFQIKGAYLSLVDPLVWITGLLWVISVFLDPSERSPLKKCLPPWPHLAFVGLIALSLVNAENKLDSIREIIQAAEYLLVAFLLFSRLSIDEKQLQYLLYLLLVLVSVTAGWGLLHYLQSSRGILQVKASFGNRNVYSGFLAVTLPLVLAVMLYVRSWAARIWLGLVFLAGSISMLAGGAMLALLLAGTLTCALKSSRVLLGWLIFVLLMGALVLPHLPRENISVLRSSVSFYDDKIKVEPRYTEWQASLQMWEEYPLCGVGIGNYQEQIGTHYGYLSIPEGEKEPDHNNFFLVLASSAGWLGILAFLGMFFSWMVRSLRVYFNSIADLPRQLALGAIGALVAFAVASIWTALMVRGVFLPFIIILALPILAASAKKNEIQPE